MLRSPLFKEEQTYIGIGNDSFEMSPNVPK